MIDGYLDIIKKYPELKEDILELRRNKNKAWGIVTTFALIIGGFIGYLVRI